MRTPTVDIFGSCIARDALEHSEKAVLLGRYFARSSLISAYSKPIEINADAISLGSAFQCRIVTDDLTKAFRRFLESTKCADYLVIDFIDERYDVYEYSENHYYTFSSEHNISGLRLRGKKQCIFAQSLLENRIPGW